MSLGLDINDFSMFELIDLYEEKNNNNELSQEDEDEFALFICKYYENAYNDYNAPSIFTKSVKWFTKSVRWLYDNI